MPELPEVETVVRSVAPHITGKTIRSAEFRSKHVTQGNFTTIARSLAGARIESINRTGKHIVVQLDRGLLHIHLGMTGKLLWNASLTPYTRAVFELENGTLVFDDIRQFGKVNFYRQPPKGLTQLGPDVLSLSFDAFSDALRKRSGGLKALLLNQRFVSGIGNIYADEILFAARIHPKARTGRLSPSRIRRLYDEMRRILEYAILHKGSSISDYVDSAGNRGAYQGLHQVYGKASQPCPVCGSAIRRIVIGQRGTHYCPHCQRP